VTTSSFLPSFSLCREAHYSLGVTPLVLLWKDARCSKYFLDTDSQGVIPPEQQVGIANPMAKQRQMIEMKGGGSESRWLL
jgi:hypothetical protein